MNSYNKLAFAYDFLKWVVFGNRLNQAAVVHLKYIKPNTRILVIGGGTGWILEHLNRVKSIDFVEPSQAMMKRAQRRTCKTKIHFHQVHFDEFNGHGLYDYIICNYFLDLFPPNDLEIMVNKCRTLLSPNGLLLVTDFIEAERNSGTINRGLIQLIIWFFRITTNYPNKKIPPIQYILKTHNFEAVVHDTDKRQLLFSGVYRITS